MQQQDDQVPKSPAGQPKSDEELLREHNIKECKVLLRGASQVDKKPFDVHYGQNFLREIALRAYNRTARPDLDKLYETFITSRFSSLDRPQFKSTLRTYFAEFDNDFRRMRMKLIKQKLKELHEIRAANRKCKLTYREHSVVVPYSNVEGAKSALKNLKKTMVVLERVDSPATSNDDVMSVGTPQSVSTNSPAPSGDNSNPGSTCGPSSLQAGRDSSNPGSTCSTSNLQAGGENSNPGSTCGPSSLQAGGDNSNPGSTCGPSSLQAGGDNSNPGSTCGPSSLQAGGDNSNPGSTCGPSSLQAGGDNSNPGSSGETSNPQPSCGASNLQASGNNSNLSSTGDASNPPTSSDTINPAPNVEDPKVFPSTSQGVISLPRDTPSPN